MGILHTEIQTKDSTLTTLPNIYLITNPVDVTPANDALISATVSLGYNIPCSQVESLLLAAAEKADLENSFVQINELGDFSITYRVAGFLVDAKHIITARSTLRKQMITSLHEGGVEIVSPTFMNQRQYKPQDSFISIEKTAESERKENEKLGEKVENKVFDKAEIAEKISELEDKQDKFKELIKELKKEKPEGYKKKISEIESRIDSFAEKIEALQNKTEE